MVPADICEGQIHRGSSSGRKPASKKDEQLEHDCARRVTQAARKCAGVFSQQELITVYLQSMPKTVRPVLRLHRPGKVIAFI